MNPHVVGHLELQLMRLRRYDPGDATAPVQELSYG
jgi:hypothetical protein